MNEVRSEGAASTSNEGETDAHVRELEEGIQQTRANMSATISELETRLAPEEVREKVGAELKQLEDRVRGVVHEQLEEAKTLLQAELTEAKGLLRDEMDEAEEKIRRGLSDARSAVKSDVKEAITGARQAVRAATLGKVEDLATNLGDKMNETRDTLVDTIRNNPVPATVMGVGLVWLLMNRSRSAASRRGASNRGYQFREHEAFGEAENIASEAGSTVRKVAHQIGDAAGKGLHQATDAASHAAQTVSQRAQDLGQRAGEAASHLADQAGDAVQSVAVGAKRVEETLENALHENPMAVGAAALALGAVVGFALPRTESENSLMGEARDRLLSQAGDVAHDAAASASEFAEQTVQTALKAERDDSASAPR
jgi:ElaB/YqjD/DUF883 family membrane-anchored ribosome-binding protein